MIKILSHNKQHFSSLQHNFSFEIAVALVVQEMWIEHFMFLNPFSKGTFLQRLNPCIHMPKTQTRMKRTEQTFRSFQTEPPSFLVFNCLAVRPSVRCQLGEEPRNLVQPSISEFATKTFASPSRLFGMFAHLLCQQRVYHPSRKDSYICNKPIAFWQAR